jgi:hypothetical protein
MDVQLTVAPIVADINSFNATESLARLMPFQIGPFGRQTPHFLAHYLALTSITHILSAAIHFFGFVWLEETNALCEENDTIGNGGAGQKKSKRLSPNRRSGGYRGTSQQLWKMTKANGPFSRTRVAMWEPRIGAHVTVERRFSW